MLDSMFSSYYINRLTTTLLIKQFFKCFNVKTFQRHIRKEFNKSD